MYGELPIEDGITPFVTPGTGLTEITYVEPMPRSVGNTDSIEAEGRTFIEMIDV